MPHAHILLLAPVEMAKLLSRSGLDSPFEREHFTLPYLPFLHPLHSLTHHSLSTKAPPVLSSSLLGCWKGPPPPTTPSRAVNTRSLCRSGPGFMELTYAHMNTQTGVSISVYASQKRSNIINILPTAVYPTTLSLCNPTVVRLIFILLD